MTQNVIIPDPDRPCDHDNTLGQELNRELKDRLETVKKQLRVHQELGGLLQYEYHQLTGRYWGGYER